MIDLTKKANCIRLEPQPRMPGPQKVWQWRPRGKSRTWIWQDKDLPALSMAIHLDCPYPATCIVDCRRHLTICPWKLSYLDGVWYWVYSKQEEAKL